MSDMSISGESFSTSPTLEVPEDVNSEMDSAQLKAIQQGILASAAPGHRVIGKDLSLGLVYVMGASRRGFSGGALPIPAAIRAQLEQIQKQIDHALASEPKTAPHHECVTLLSLRMTARSNNKQTGNAIKVKPGESILGEFYYSFDTKKMNQPESFNPNLVQQIVIGIDGENTQTSTPLAVPPNGQIIEARKFFMIKAPQKPGTYDIRFRYEQASNLFDGMISWNRVGGAPESATIGKITVED